jgi:hypothetical protein
VRLTFAGNILITGPIVLKGLNARVALFYDGANWRIIGGLPGAEILEVQVFS